MILRIATLLVCLMLAACAGGKMPGTSDTTSSISSFLPSSFSTPALDPPEGSPADDRTVKTRAQCWAKVEHEKNLRGIDQRVGYVDRCVAAQLQQ
jgi:hypothetical protein